VEFYQKDLRAVPKALAGVGVPCGCSFDIVGAKVHDRKVATHATASTENIIFG
jgi:hypothetical protein